MTLQPNISNTFTFLLSALLIPHGSAPYNAVGTITHSYRHFLAFIPSPLLLSFLFSAPHTLYPSFILCTTPLSHPQSAATCDPRYLKQSTSSNGSPFRITCIRPHYHSSSTHNFTYTYINSQLSSFAEFRLILIVIAPSRRAGSGTRRAAAMEWRASSMDFLFQHRAHARGGARP